MSRIVFIEHEADCPPAWVGDWLADAGAEIVVVRPYLGEPLGGFLGDFADADGVVILGGSMGANDDDAVAWLGPLKQAVRDLHGRGVPTLGICLGHQLIAAALGGKVAPNPAGQTVGLVPLGWTEAQEGDPVMRGVRAEARSVFWNDDVVQVLPHGATLLAASPDGQPQAIRFGDAMWGVQFHPEVDAKVLRLWVEDGHRDRERLLAAIEETRGAEPELAATWRPLAEGFLSCVRGDRA
jgi:GMP synthase (glutamine-hydrolysing)